MLQVAIERIVDIVMAAAMVAIITVIVLAVIVSVKDLLKRD